MFGRAKLQNNRSFDPEEVNFWLYSFARHCKGLGEKKKGESMGVLAVLAGILLLVGR